MAGARRKARMVALQALYEMDLSDHAPEQALARLGEEHPPSQEVTDFARALVLGVAAHRREIDSLIQRHAPQWPVAQLSPIDRNILRLAIFEMFMDNRVPIKVAINEAVELAKAFGSDHSSRFVNGVLGTLSDKVARPS